MSPPSLLSVPNVSEGARPGVVAAIGQAITRENGSDEGAARLLDVHFDRDHDRAVFTVAGRQGTIAEAMLRCGREAVERIDVMDGGGGQHPHVGALDVVPVVYLRSEARGAACAEARVIAPPIGAELHIPPFLSRHPTPPPSSPPPPPPPLT